MKKTLLHITKYYYPVEGGIETVTKYLVDGMESFESSVVCFGQEGKTVTDYRPVYQNIQPGYCLLIQETS